jgi:hypothetical protein
LHLPLNGPQVFQKVYACRRNLSQRLGFSSPFGKPAAGAKFLLFRFLCEFLQHFLFGELSLELEKVANAGSWARAPCARCDSRDTQSPGSSSHALSQPHAKEGL